MSKQQEALRLALEALNTTESDCGSRAWEREQEAIAAMREVLDGTFAPDAALALNNCWFVSYIDFSQTPPYFRYDTDDNTVKENETELYEIQEQLRERGFELVGTLVEHDCITGSLSALDIKEST